MATMVATRIGELRRSRPLFAAKCGEVRYGQYTRMRFPVVPVITSMTSQKPATTI